MVASLFRYVYNRVRISITYMNLDMIIFKSLKKMSCFFNPGMVLSGKIYPQVWALCVQYIFTFFFYLRPTCNSQKPLEMLKNPPRSVSINAKWPKSKIFVSLKFAEIFFFSVKLKKLKLSGTTILNMFFLYKNIRSLIIWIKKKRRMTRFAP